MVFALLRAAESDKGRYQSLARLVSREEVEYCDKHCEKYVKLWEANNHIYENPAIYENLNPNPNAWYESPQP
eukprot:CAMPEP_0196718196 /NCGR_PEP_ID=MMETSP1091-20130531/1476_1 /TAXON_ID=302021 /ORGANISM="Rhodomonas sp., Strain CCMP768" /LENGTH=71 /DNA_ID=CAMNT_0042058807 /DNA_START=78 /DNA_END=293 /DNA_ORIENTATION=-